MKIINICFVLYLINSLSCKAALDSNLVDAVIDTSATAIISSFFPNLRKHYAISDPRIENWIIDGATNKKITGQDTPVTLKVLNHADACLVQKELPIKEQNHKALNILGFLYAQNCTTGTIGSLIKEAAEYNTKVNVIFAGIKASEPGSKPKESYQTYTGRAADTAICLEKNKVPYVGSVFNIRRNATDVTQHQITYGDISKILCLCADQK